MLTFLSRNYHNMYFLSISFQMILHYQANILLFFILSNSRNWCQTLTKILIFIAKKRLFLVTFVSMTSPWLELVLAPARTKRIPNKTSTESLRWDLMAIGSSCLYSSYKLGLMNKTKASPTVCLHVLTCHVTLLRPV